MGRTVLVTAVALVLAVPGVSHAQLRGHYVPGFTGLQNGTQGPPAVTIIAPSFLYTTDTLKDDHGHSLGAHPDIKSSFVGPGLIWVTNTKVLGARLGVQAIPIAFMKSQIEGRVLNSEGSFRFTDIYVQPVQLGWEKPRADFVAGWGVFLPTGAWELGGDENGGLGMWSNLVQAGTTVRLDDVRAWTSSVLATYEMHSKKDDTEIKVGNILTLEGGTGKSFYKKVSDTPLPRITTIGVVYYGQFKMTHDSAPIITPLLEGLKDHVFGVGVEGSVFLPAPKLLVGLRVEPEFGAVNRTQGVTFTLTLAYQAKSLVKLPNP